MPELDRDSKELLASLTWSHSELCEEDEQ